MQHHFDLFKTIGSQQRFSERNYYNIRIQSSDRVWNRYIVYRTSLSDIYILQNISASINCKSHSYSLHKKMLGYWFCSQGAVSFFATNQRTGPYSPTGDFFFCRIVYRSNN